MLEKFRFGRGTSTRPTADAMKASTSAQEKLAAMQVKLAELRELHGDAQIDEELTPQAERAAVTQRVAEIKAQIDAEELEEARLTNIIALAERQAAAGVEREVAAAKQATIEEHNALIPEYVALYREIEPLLRKLALRLARARDLADRIRISYHKAGGPRLIIEPLQAESQASHLTEFLHHLGVVELVSENLSNTGRRSADSLVALASTAADNYRISEGRKPSDFLAPATRRSEAPSNMASAGFRAD